MVPSRVPRGRRCPLRRPRAQPGAAGITSRGDYSLARQLGLGVSRIVIDAGHGGHDPGAQANGVNEAELVLDVAHAAAQAAHRSPGFDVVLTRQTDEFIPLEERTAIANREDADLFLSIHANASRQPGARGVETYILNFATNPDGRSGRRARERDERADHGHAAGDPQGDRAQQQARRIARAGDDSADLARPQAAHAEQGRCAISA